MIAQFVPQATIVPSTFSCRSTRADALESGDRKHRRRAATAAAVARAAVARVDDASGTSNALSSSDLLFNGLNYVAQHPFVNDPVRPGKVDRVSQRLRVRLDHRRSRPKSMRTRTIPSRDRAQERVSQVPQGRNRADRRVRAVRRSAGRSSGTTTTSTAVDDR